MNATEVLTHQRERALAIIAEEKARIDHQMVLLGSSKDRLRDAVETVESIDAALKKLADPQP